MNIKDVKKTKNSNTNIRYTKDKKNRINTNLKTRQYIELQPTQRPDLIADQSPGYSHHYRLQHNIEINI